MNLGKKNSFELKSYGAKTPHKSHQFFRIFIF